MATALRIHCAERTCAMQLVCMCASILAPDFSQNVCVWKDMRCKYGKKVMGIGVKENMEVQVWIY